MDLRPAHLVPHVEVSVVMPCLNEADTLATCIEKAQRAISEHGLDAEIIVADNGSTDGSQDIATAAGAVLVEVRTRGYGAALMAGIERARGTYVVMGDADDSYDWLALHHFVDRLRQGFDLVQGCRLNAAGGRIMPGAMPFLHRWLGNPLLTFLAREWFGTPVHDVYCGMRGFRKEAYLRLDQRCTGMEFATEMIIKARLLDISTSEVPVTLFPDGRKAHPPHLKTFRDGWRTLRFFLLYSPRWLFLLPGAMLVILGLIGYSIALPGYSINGVTFDAHTLLFASLAIMLGFQAIAFAILSKVFAISEGLLPKDPRIDRFFRRLPLERGILAGSAGLFFGVILLAVAVNAWRLSGFGPLDYARTMRWVIPGVTLSALGFQTIFFSFFASILGLRRL